MKEQPSVVDEHQEVPITPESAVQLMQVIALVCLGLAMVINNINAYKRQPIFESLFEDLKSRTSQLAAKSAVDTGELGEGLKVGTEDAVDF